MQIIAVDMYVSDVVLIIQRGLWMLGVVTQPREHSNCSDFKKLYIRDVQGLGRSHYYVYVLSNVLLLLSTHLL